MWYMCKRWTDNVRKNTLKKSHYFPNGESFKYFESNITRASCQMIKMLINVQFIANVIASQHNDDIFTISCTSIHNFVFPF